MREAVIGLGAGGRMFAAVLALLAVFMLVSGECALAQTNTAEARIMVLEPAGAAIWARGQAVTIKWEATGLRGSVRIQLVDGERKVTIKSNATASGSLEWTVAATAPPGGYTLQVTSLDGRVVDEAGPITITAAVPGARTGSVSPAAPARTPAKTAPGTVAAPPVVPTVPSPVKPGVAPRPSVSTPGGGTGGLSAGSTGAGPQIQGGSGLSQTPSTGLQNANQTPIVVPGLAVGHPQVNGARVDDPGDADELNDAVDGESTYLPGSMQQAGTVGIDVIRPVAGDWWEAGQEYTIQWNGMHVPGDVRVSLVQHDAGHPGRWLLVPRTASSGTCRYLVPAGLSPSPHHFQVEIAALEGSVVGTNEGTLAVYTQAVDVVPEIRGLTRLIERVDEMFYYECDRRIIFDVYVINQGTRQPLSVPLVMRVIKEPENVVVQQDEFAISGVYAHAWYKVRPSYNIEYRSYELYTGLDVNWESGRYRIEVEADPGNTLGELGEARINNRSVVVFRVSARPGG